MKNLIILLSFCVCLVTADISFDRVWLLAEHPSDYAQLLTFNDTGKLIDSKSFPSFPVGVGNNQTLESAINPLIQEFWVISENKTANNYQSVIGSIGYKSGVTGEQHSVQNPPLTKFLSITFDQPSAELVTLAINESTNDLTLMGISKTNGSINWKFNLPEIAGKYSPHVFATDIGLGLVAIVIPNSQSNWANQICVYNRTQNGQGGVCNQYNIDIASIKANYENNALFAIARQNGDNKKIGLYNLNPWSGNYSLISMYPEHLESSQFGIAHLSYFDKLYHQFVTCWSEPNGDIEIIAIDVQKKVTSKSLKLVFHAPLEWSIIGMAALIDPFFTPQPSPTTPTPVPTTPQLPPLAPLAPIDPIPNPPVDVPVQVPTAIQQPNNSAGLIVGFLVALVLIIGIVGFGIYYFRKKRGVYQALI